MNLGTIDDSGVWVAPVVFIYDEDLNIYWMSDPDVRHSKAVQFSPKVSASIVAREKGGSNLAIQFEGIAEKIEGNRPDLAVKHYSKRGKKMPEPNEDVLQGDSWYKVRPISIRLNDQENFGYEKQTYVLG